MKQVIQNYKTGDLYVDDVPTPSLSEGMVLVKNNFSLISAGTEKGTVKVAKSSLVGKAKQRPDLVKQVLANMKKEGVKATLDKVRTKLDSLAALGYASAGEVLGSLDKDNKFKAGDRVACAGQNYASHADVVSVPQNLVVKLPENVSYEEASFTTLGAIAMQGVRQAEPKLGENVLVIGLGLLGQITCQLLKANGCNVFGVDLSPKLVEIAEEISADQALNRNDPNLETAAMNFAKGQGFDSVIITAAAPSNDPIELGSMLARKKAAIVIVGAVKMDIPREPYFYKKELELKMSCSYGPGRYDTDYEENGNDYPYAYVRWTEGRNMEAFIDLISKGLINLKPLITHTFDIAEAEAAYKIVMGEVQEPFIGILLKYPELKGELETKIKIKGTEAVKGNLNVGFIGAGSFAQSYLIPNAKSAGANLKTAVTSKGITAKSVGQKFQFENSSATSSDVTGDASIDTVFVATQHNTHAKYCIEALEAGKNVFVEKPVAMNMEELAQVSEAYNKSNSKLMVGFNRRFAPVSIEAKNHFKNIGEPLVMNFRVNGGFIPKEHWTQNDELGGGRIIGEMCHFIDLMQYFTGSNPKRVYADCIDHDNAAMKNDDNIIITVKFEDGSVGNLTYLANGDKALAKEYIEIFGGERSFIIDNFRQGLAYAGNKELKVKLDGKGHKQEVQEFLASVKAGKECPISFESIYKTTLTTFKIVDSLNTGLPQEIN